MKAIIVIMNKFILVFMLSVIVTLTLPISSTVATEKGQVTNLPIPRFVSLKATKSNIRRGPSKTHKIDWVFVKKNIPLKIVDEFGHWRRIIDYEGASGWIHKSLLSGSRTVLILEDMVPLYLKPTTDSIIRAKIEKNVIGSLGKCKLSWCFVKFSSDKGWVNRKDFWGLIQNELRE